MLRWCKTMPRAAKLRTGRELLTGALDVVFAEDNDALRLFVPDADKSSAYIVKPCESFVAASLMSLCVLSRGRRQMPLSQPKFDPVAGNWA